MNRNILFTCLGSTVRPMFDIGGPLKLKKSDKVLLREKAIERSVAEINEAIRRFADKH